MANIGFQYDAVSNRLRELDSQREKLHKKIDKCTAETVMLSMLSEDERKNYIDLDIKLYPDISTRIQNRLYEYGKENHWPMPITPRFIFNKGRKAISRIPGIGEFSLIDLRDFFSSKGLSWK